MEQEAPSPHITHMSWGRLEVAGKLFKDAKLYPGGSREWDWRETGTHHVPSIPPEESTRNECSQFGIHKMLVRQL